MSPYRPLKTYLASLTEINKLLLVVLLKAIFMAGVILYSGIGLGPDEAQYWTWSKQLDWGYYSKPPGIAWTIWIGTLFFGDTELGVRFGSLVFGTLIPIAIYYASRANGLKPNTSFWAALIMALTPLGVMSTLLAITDVGMILFWTLALACVLSYYTRQTPPNYLLIGVLIMAGALFKWPIYLFWVIVAGIAVFLPHWRRLSLLTGMAISLLGLLPSLWWNYSHDWVTFRHVFSTIKAATPQEAAKGNLLEFIGAQVGLLSPILFVLLIAGCVHYMRRPNKQMAVVACSALIPLAIGIFLSFFKKILGNWCVFAYPSVAIFLAWYLCERVSWGKLWLKIGLGVSLVLCLLMVLSPLKTRVFKHNVGWTNLASSLLAAGYHPDRDFVFGDKYQSASLLSFYGPEQKRAYFLNINQTRKNQFSFWPGMKQEQLNKDGYFVVTENYPHASKIDPEYIVKQLSSYFKGVEFAGKYALVPEKKEAFIFKGESYNGKIPDEVLLY